MFAFIRKFGLEYIELPTIMWNLSFLLRALTLNIETKRYRKTQVIFFILTPIAAGCYFYVYLVSMVWFVFWRCMETGDKLAALIVFSQGVASEIGPVKLLYMILHMTKVRNIVASCLASDNLVKQGSRFSTNLQKTLRKVKRRAIVIWLIVMTNGIVYIIKPFVMPGRHLMDDTFMYYGLEPMFESPNYEIALAITIMGVLFTCYSTACITTFVIVSTGYVEAQMRAWSEELILLWDDAVQYAESKIKTLNNMRIINASAFKDREFNTFVKERLRDIIKSHARNLDLLQQIEDVFRGAIAVEFFILIIALIAELLGGLENTYMEVPFSFVQVAMDCLAGQRLSDASEVFERAVYHCGWEHFDRSNMKLVLLMLHSSQKTMTLSAGGLAMLNYSCLMSVVRYIYSAYTTLRSTMM